LEPNQCYVADSCVRYCGIRDGLSRLNLVTNIDTTAECSLWNTLISIVGQSPCRQTNEMCSWLFHFHRTHPNSVGSCVA